MVTTGIRALLIDLDGVLYQGDVLIRGADQVVEWLVRENFPHRFVTNTTSRPRKAIWEKLNALGIPAVETEILTPPIVARDWLTAHTRGAVALLVPDSTKNDFASLEILPHDAQQGASAVVVGDIGSDWTFENLNRAFRLLMDEPKPILVALGMTRYWHSGDGLQLDVAPFVKALQHASDCETVVMGKPSAEFFHQALASLACPAHEALMIGDDIKGDVLAAQDTGIHGALVKTGKFRLQDLQSGNQPDVVLNSIADLPEFLLHI